MPECPDFQVGDEWHPLSPPPLVGGDEGEGEEIVSDESQKYRLLRRGASLRKEGQNYT